MQVDEFLNDQANRIERVLAAQGLQVRVVGGTVGPRLVVFQAVKPASVKLSAVMRMDEEIALGLGVPACRIARNGRYLTIEIPRRDPEVVHLLGLLDRLPPPARGTGGAGVVVGVDEEGTPLVLPLGSPNIGHVLICGTTGSGKTALARAMIAGLATGHAVYELSLVLIDPKRRGYVPFAGLPHLAHPVIHEPEEALGALAWAVEDLERRDREGVSPSTSSGRGSPRMVIFIDELADLMQTAGEEVEASLTRLVQRGREAGVHVVACTQKPTAAVIGSLVKANFPCRIVGRVTDTNDAYVASGISGTGAERLLGKGDFLVVAGGDVVRMQGAYISEAEVRDLVTRLRGGRPLESGKGKKEKGKWRVEGGKGEEGGWKMENGRGKGGKEKSGKGSKGIRGQGRVLDFVERFREHSDGDAGDDGRGGHNKKDPTEEMITFAMVKILDDGEVTPYAVQKFHQDRTGSLCSRGRAERAIAVARNRAQTANSKNGKGETGTDA